MKRMNRRRFKDGSRTVMESALGNGLTDTSFVYNLIDYSGDMSDYVVLSRHLEIKEAIKEARKVTTDLKWAAPWASSCYIGVPPRIVRTVRFTELHRIEVRGPLPKSEVERREFEARKREAEELERPGGIERHMRKLDRAIKRLSREIAVDRASASETSAPHPRISELAA